ncbi:MAG: molybdopterin-guanine dinucleotide biosynthesis protein MobB [Deltaproteobacteria bacterium]|nr:molybdopterin-guanine dinucleotide biosynthesis protein MobB [Deltaproteobacteria bacterium]
MKVVGIIGFKKSGKTTLGNRLSAALMNRGMKVAVFKNAAHHDVSTETDTGKYREHCHFVAALSSGGVSMFLRGARSVEEILSLAESDLVVLEGFKQERTYPKIVCLRDREEEKDLFDGLQLFTASFRKGISDFEIDSEVHVERMADAVLEKAFKLPALDCGRCGRPACYDLAREIVGGRTTPADCVFHDLSIRLRIDGKTVPLERLPGALLTGILPILPFLKDGKKAVITIGIP